MKTKALTGILLLFLWAISFASCSDDKEPKNKVQTIKMYVSHETGTYQPWGSDRPITCMLVKKEGEAEYQPFALTEIKDFEYEEGYEYILLVERTTLVNPPADASAYTYQLIEVLDRTWMLPPEPITYTLDDIQYYEGCPYHIYNLIHGEWFINSEGELTVNDGWDYYYDISRIYIEYALTWEDKYHNKLDYMGISAFVLDPFMRDESDPSIRLIRNTNSGPAINDVMTEETFEYMRTEAAVGEKITYKIIFVNASQLALQEVEVTFIKE